MDKSRIINILAALHSAKLKDKKDGLNELTTILKNEPKLLQSRDMQALATTLIEVLDLEQRKFCDLVVTSTENTHDLSKLRLSEERLSSTAYVLRLFIEKTVPLFKQKTLNFLLAALPELMVDMNSKQLIPTVSVHLTVALNELVTSDAFVLKYTETRWIDITARLLEFLQQRVDNKNLNDRITTNILLSLSSLLNLDTVGLYQIRNINDTIINFIRYCTKENANTRLILKIVNILIIKRHCIDLIGTLELIVETFQYVVILNESKNKDTQHEIIVLSYISSELIGMKLFDINDNGYTDTKISKEAMSSILREYLIIRLNKYKPHLLPTSSIGFSYLTRRKRNVVSDDYFQIQEDDSVLKWLDLISLVRLLLIYFSISTNSASYLFSVKRGRIINDCSNYLRSSLNITEFISNCISASDSTSINILGYQVMLCYGIYYDMDRSNILTLKEKIFRTIETEQDHEWAILSLIPLLSQRNYSFDGGEALKLFKMGLNLLKTKKMCRVSCIFLIQLIQYTSSMADNNKLLDDISDVYEYAEMNGPIIICQESLELWQYLHIYGSSISMGRDLTPAIKICQWFESKWTGFNQGFIKADSLSTFFAWLAGQDVTRYYFGKETMKQISLTDNYLGSSLTQWFNQSESRNFLISSYVESKYSKRQRKFNHIPLIEVNLISIDNLLKTLLLDARTQFKDHGKDLIEYCMVLLLIIDKFQDISSRQHYISQCRELLRGIFNNNEVVGKKEISLLLLNLEFLQIYHGLGGLSQLMDYDNLLSLLSNQDASNICISGNTTLNDEVDFPEVFTIKTVKSRIDSLQPAIVVENILIIYQKHGVAKFFDKLLNDIVMLSWSDMYHSLEIIIKWLDLFMGDDNFDETDALLDKLTQFFGENLLGIKYNTSSLSIDILAMHLDNLQRYWIIKSQSEIGSDYCDIIEWILLRLEDDSFSGEQAYIQTSMMFLHLLQNNDVLPHNINGGKKRLFQALIKGLRNLPYTSRNIVFEQIPNYINALSSKNQYILISELEKLYHFKNNSFEVAIFYLYMLKSISVQSYTITAFALQQILEFDRGIKFRRYVMKIIQIVTSEFGLKNSKNLFDYFKYDLLHYFCQCEKTQNLNLERWNIDIFGFENKSEFIERNRREIVALYCSMDLKLDSFGSSLYHDQIKTQRALLEYAFPLALPLSILHADDVNKLEGLPFFQQKYSKLNKKYSLIITKFILRLTDLGNILEIKNVFTSFHENSQLICRMFDDESIRYHFPLNIKSKDGFRILQEYKSGGLMEPEFLIKWIIRDLETSKTLTEKRRCIREIKVLILWFHDSIRNTDIFKYMTISLSSHILQEELFQELIPVLSLFFTTIDNTRSDLTEAFVNIFLYLIISQKNKGPWSQYLCNQISTIDFKEYVCEEMWDACVDIINKREISRDICKYMGAFLTETRSKEAVSLSSLLLGEMSAQYLITGSILSQEQLREIIEIKIPDEHMTSQYKMWLSLSISLIDQPFKSEKEYSQRIKQKLLEVSTFPNYTYHVISTLLEYYNENLTKKNSSNMFLTSTVLGYLISLSKTDTTLQLFDEQQIAQYEKNVCHVDENILGFISESKVRTQNIKYLFEKIYFNSEVQYRDWIQCVVNALINSLEIDYPYLKALSILTENSVRFSEHIFVELLGLSIYSNPKSSIEWVPAMFNKMDVLFYSQESRFKLDILAQGLLLLRCGHRNGNPQFSRLYTRINLNNLFGCYITLNMNHLSLMLYEELHMGENLPLDHHTLERIYEKLDERRFLLGLPPARLLSNTLQRINDWGTDYSKAFMFNNAKFDSDFNEDNLGPLICSSDRNGYYGISRSLSKQSNDKDDSYRWSMSLSKWEIPSPDSISTKSGGLYKAIKGISDKSQNIQTLLSKCLEDVIDSYSSFQDKEEWTFLVKELVGYKNMAHIVQRSEDLVAQLDMDFQKRVENTKYGELQIIDLDSHSNFFKAMFGNNAITSTLDEGKLNLYSSAILIRNTKLAIREGYSQYALRNSFLLEELALQKTSNFNEASQAHICCTSRYLVAKSLWMSGEKKTAVDMLRYIFEQRLFERDTNTKSHATFMYTNIDEMRSTLVEWLSELRLEPTSKIYQNYVREYKTLSNDPEINSKCLNIIGDFLRHQVHKTIDSGEIENIYHRNQIDLKELNDLRSIFENEKFPINDRKDARSRIARLKLQIRRDNEKLKSLNDHKEMYTLKALINYLDVLTLTDKYDGDVIDKFCELWFENDKEQKINKTLNDKLKSVPIWKFIPWVNQIASRLSAEDTSFQTLLGDVVIRLVCEAPFDSIYSLISILLYRDKSIENDENMTQKVGAVRELLKKVKRKMGSQFFDNYVSSTLEFCKKSVELANEKFADKTSFVILANLNIGKYWFEDLPSKNIPLPTMNIKYNYTDGTQMRRPYIVKVEEKVEISSSGISLPKIVTFVISNGKRHKVLLKGSNDDLRQDAIMEQVFRQVNNILNKSTRGERDGPAVRTYQVIPLGPRAGLIEFVANSIPLHKVLTELHKRDDISLSDARKIMKQVQNKSNEERLKAYLKITDSIKPKLHNFFFNSFLDPDDWYEAKKKYIKSIATTSIVGHILGLGDRHLNNLLLDSSTGEIIHIDLGIAFDQGRLLAIPELVPFRLTRDIVDGLGVTGVNGLFRAECERIYSIMRANHDKVMCVLNILKWDPLYSWVMSPVKKHKHALYVDDSEDPTVADNSNVSRDLSVQPLLRICDINSNKSNNIENENREAHRALKTVGDKLSAHGLSVEATVQELIQEATDENNLAVIFCGWSPFY